jgi:hypothetical protein
VMTRRIERSIWNPTFQIVVNVFAAAVP